jgi:hypothetical protein
MRMLTPFQFCSVLPFQFDRRNFLFAKFGWRLIPMWPFGETNAAAMRTLKPAGLRRRVSLLEPLRHLTVFSRIDAAPSLPSE